MTKKPVCLCKDCYRSVVSRGEKVRVVRSFLAHEEEYEVECDICGSDYQEITEEMVEVV